MNYKLILPFSLFLFFPFYLSSNEVLTLNDLTGDIMYSQNSKFISLDKTNIAVNKKGMYVQKPLVNVLITLSQEFNKAFPQIPFTIISASRNFQQQRQIWNQKWERFFNKNQSNNTKEFQTLSFSNKSKIVREQILQYSSLPSTSRHHWGTDIDIISVDPEYFKTSIGKKIYAWFVEYLPQYGFSQCYTANRDKGYNEEAWHWSYTVLAKNYVDSYKKLLKTPKKLISKIREVRGFSKQEISDKEILNLIEEYIFSIDSACL